jgi:kynureninase
MTDLRQKSLRLTNYLEQLLDAVALKKPKLFDTITPQDPSERGAQLSIRLAPGLLDGVLAHLEHAGIIVDERKPDVIRVAPAPLYNSFLDVFRFCHGLETALGKSSAASKS